MGRVNRRVRLALGAAVFVLVAAGVGVARSSVLAASGRSAASVLQRTPEAPAAFAKEALKATYIEHGTSGRTESGGAFTAIDPGGSVTCGAKAGKTCTVQVNMSIQLGGSTDTGNRVAFWWKVGSSGANNATFVGETLTDADFTNFSYSDFVQGVTPGTYPVQSFVSSDDGVTVEYWTITYQVFEP
jgi:hypothetical protein